MSTEPTPISSPRRGPEHASTGSSTGPASAALRDTRERLARSVSLLQAALDSTADGILIVDTGGRIVRFNRRFLEIWELPEEVVASELDDRALEHAAAKLEDPDGFRARVAALYRDPTQTSFDVLRFRDGRLVERYSRPQRLGDRIVGRVWSFRDVTEQRRIQEALLSSERRYRRLFEESRHALYITTRDGSFVDVNRSMLELFGCTRQELLKLTARDLYADGADRDLFQKEMAARGSVRNYEAVLRNPEGQRLDCLITATARRNGDGEVVGYEGIIEDITERKRSTEALRRSEEYFRSLIDHALDTITILGADGTITYESPSVERVLGYAPEELVGTRVLRHVHPEDRATAREAWLRAAGTPGAMATFELRFRHRDGGWRALEAVGRNLLDDPVVGGFVVNARDVTQRKEAEARLVYDAFHDRLTGLPNRALFMDRLAHLLKRSARDGAPRFSVLFADADRFKVVNDSLGHSVGDRLLVAIGRRLERCLRPSDTVSRVGGDEFALLLDGTESAADAEVVARRIHEAMNHPFHIDGREIYASLSLGIAVSAPEYVGGDEIMRDADIAMYTAKKTGRARTAVFDRPMHQQAMDVLELETSLRHAVEREQLSLHYQPIVSLSSGALLGFESLLRWNHPTRGQLMPAEFLGLAEETGLIVSMGLWTLEEAARTARAWRDRDGAPIYVAVNLSATQLSQPDLVERVAEILDRTGAPPDALRLELTEDVLLEHGEATLRTMRRLRELGVRLMIDDFGIGYSSLAYLHRFAADTLKIDGSFITGIGPNGENSEIVRTIVALADELGMEVVAEGVETPAQFRIVRILGCSSAQGYHLARPAPATHAEDTLGRVWELG